MGACAIVILQLSKPINPISPSINHSAPKPACTICPRNTWCMQPSGPAQSLFCSIKSIIPSSPSISHNLRDQCNHYSAVSSQPINPISPPINHSAPKPACTVFPRNKWRMQPYGPVQSLLFISKSINPQSVHQSTIRPQSLHAPFPQVTKWRVQLYGPVQSMFCRIMSINPISKEIN